MEDYQLDWQDERWILHKNRAVFRPATSSLLVSDLHLGKTTHFQRSGIPLPNGSDATTLARLSAVISRFQPSQIFLLGDLFHSHINQAWDKFTSWRRQYSSIPFVLVKGNHDILPAEKYKQAMITAITRYEEAGVQYIHEIPSQKEIQPTIGGHIHPGITLRAKGKQRLKLPCFHIQANSFTLPAMGSFTGLAEIEKRNGDLIFVLTEQAVLKMDWAQKET